MRLQEAIERKKRWQLVLDVIYIHNILMMILIQGLFGSDLNFSSKNVIQCHSFNGIITQNL